MIQFNFSENCCGCRACENICPVHAIHMNKDNAGFLFPYIDKDKCVECGLCDKLCPHLNADSNRRNEQIPKSWLYASKTPDVKLRSSSGGAFYELAHKAIFDGYHVVGCAWDSELKAEHIIVSNEDDLKLLQGSKYVQSDMKNCCSEVKKLLMSGEKVLFSGTPCQVEAVHNTAMLMEAGNYRENLITVGVICHGVAAPKAWESYKKYLLKKYGSRLVNVNFRNKEKEGYKKSYCKYDFENNSTIYLPTFLPSSKYIEATLVYNLAMRECCSKCDCKGITSACDIILGDWYEEYKKEGCLGTSCLVVFTEKGKNVVYKYLENIRPISYEKIVEENGFIENSVSLPENRDKFLANLDNIEVWDSVEKLYPSKYMLKKWLVKLRLYEFVKRVIN